MRFLIHVAEQLNNRNAPTNAEAIRATEGSNMLFINQYESITTQQQKESTTTYIGKTDLC